MKTTVVINRGQMGQEDDEPGTRILKTFFSKAAGVQGLDTMVFCNSGVLTIVEG
jgi:hypothetical protein